MDQPELAARMRDQLQAWQASVGARFPTPNLPPEEVAADPEAAIGQD